MMRAWLSGAFVLALGLPAAAQDKDENPEIVVDKEHGMSMNRPPRSEKWKCFSEGGWFGKNSGCSVRHVIDDLGMDAIVQFGPTELNKSWGPIKQIGEGVLGKYEEGTKPKDGRDPQWKDVKVIKRDHKAKFPGAGGAGAYYLEMVLTDARDGKREVREWVFLKNNNLYRFVVYGAPGEYQKKLNEVNVIMKNFRVFKPEKKK